MTEVQEESLSESSKLSCNSPIELNKILKTEPSAVEKRKTISPNKIFLQTTSQNLKPPQLKRYKGTFKDDMHALRTTLKKLEKQTFIQSDLYFAQLKMAFMYGF